MNTANISHCPEVTLKCFLLSRLTSAIAQQGTLGEIPLNRSKDGAGAVRVCDRPEIG